VKGCIEHILPGASLYPILEGEDTSLPRNVSLRHICPTIWPSTTDRLFPMHVYDWLPIYQSSCKPYRSDTYGLQVIQHLSKTQLTRVTAGSQH